MVPARIRSRSPAWGKPWRFLQIPHDGIAENVKLAGLIERYLQS